MNLIHTRIKANIIPYYFVAKSNVSLEGSMVDLFGYLTFQGFKKVKSLSKRHRNFSIPSKTYEY